MATTPAFYRSVDPVDNLVVRVSVRKRTAANAPAAPAASHPGSGAQPAPTAFDDERIEHVGEFAWQQKVFGPRELLRYAHAADELRSGRRLPHSMSPLEREYVETVKKFMDAGAKNLGHVFVYRHVSTSFIFPVIYLCRRATL
jgi:hypothetical protein